MSKTVTYVTQCDKSKKAVILKSLPCVDRIDTFYFGFTLFSFPTYSVFLQYPSIFVEREYGFSMTSALTTARASVCVLPIQHTKVMAQVSPSSKKWSSSSFAFWSSRRVLITAETIDRIDLIYCPISSSFCPSLRTIRPSPDLCQRQFW